MDLNLFNDPQVRLSVFHVQLEKLHLMDFGVWQHFGVCSTFFLFDCCLRGSFEERADLVIRGCVNTYV